MDVVVLSYPRTEAIITSTSYGVCLGILKRRLQHLFSSFLRDMRRVLEGQPWNFDHCLVTCANPTGLDTFLPNQLCYSPFLIQVHFIPFVSQFLSTEEQGAGSSVFASLGSMTDVSPLGMEQGLISSVAQFNSSSLNPNVPTHCAFANHLPRITNKAKGKDVAGVKRDIFLPQTMVVGDSLRNILKRARAGPTIAEVSSAMNASLVLECLRVEES
uniref:Uncharacterized protein n=1 Tax=Cannabis sativa TaxID=3483 RepID=A0A803Q932_CANSA